MTTTPPTQTQPSTAGSDTATSEAHKPPRGNNGNGVAAAVPTMGWNSAEQGDAGDAAIGALRRFHLGADSQVASPDPETLPALLHPYRDTSRLRTDYPVVVAVTEGGLTCHSIEDQLARWQEAAGVGGRVVTDNLARLEQSIRRAMNEVDSAQAARGLVAEACERLHGDLDLKGDAAETLRGGLDALAAQVPENAVLIGFGGGSAVELAIASARAVVPARRAAFADRAQALSRGVRDLLAVEQAKSSQSRGSDALASSLGAGGLQIDTSALSRALGEHRGSVQSDDERIQRLSAAASALDAFLAEAMSAPVISIVGRAPAWLEDEGADDITVIASERPCDAALEAFDSAVAEFVVVVRAARTARLELDDAYDPAVHDGWIGGLGWDGFTEDELHCLPPVFALEEGAHLAGDALTALSRLLRSGKPVKVMAEVLPISDPDPQGKPGDAVRLELGYLGISHREAIVHQSGAARPAHLVDGLRRALDATCPSLHILAAPRNADGETAGVGGWLHTGAAIEGRAHPLFCYDPEPGVSWARRFELSGNPKPEAAWPSGAVLHRSPAGDTVTLDVAFTFADFALLEPGYRDRFAKIPNAIPDDVVAPMDEWLTLDPEDAVIRVPYVWGVSPAGELGRLAVTREIAFATRDRQRYWRTLQEWAGVHNEHVERAVAAALEEATTRHREALDEAERAHTEEVERVRREAAGEAMQRLAAALLDTDFTAMAGAPTPARAPAAPVTATPEPAAPEPAEVEEPPAAPAEAPPAVSLSFDEPFIDTPLCTSCNDCINLNPVVFVYDDNKQAKLGDVSKGTFEQLVIAAEKCPARCIHPGKPRDPDEPNLEALIARAAEFN